MICILGFMALAFMCWSEVIPDYENTEIIPESENHGSMVSLQVNFMSGAGEFEMGNSNGSNSNAPKTESKISPSMEVLFGGGAFHMGVGVEHQPLRSLDEEDTDSDTTPKFGFDSVYMVSRIDIPIASQFAIELIGRWGYNELSHNDYFLENGQNYYGSWSYDTVGGACFGGGLGISIGNRFIVQCLYTEHHAETTSEFNYYHPYYGYYNTSYNDEDIKYSQTTVGLGIRL